MSSLNSQTGRAGRLGIGGIVIARTTQWAVNPTLASSSEWGDSDSAGFTNRATGRKDATFTCEGKFDPDTEVYDTFQPEDSLEATLWLNSTLFWQFPRALCTDFSLTVNVDTEEVDGWTASFGADGVFYFPGEAGAGAANPAYPV